MTENINEVMIRKAEVADSERVYQLLLLIADLHRNGRPEMFEGLVSKYSLEQVTERLSNEDNGVFVATLDNVTVGYVFCDIIKEGSCKTLYIDDLCVDPSVRKRGIGKKLIDSAKRYGEEQKCDFLMLNVWEFNSDAVTFYKNYGFKTRTRHMEIKL